MRLSPIPLVDGSYADDSKPFSAQDTVNYLPERAEAEGTQSPWILRECPGLVLVNTIGTGPHRAAHDAEGKAILVSGTKAFRMLPRGVSGLVTEIGSVPGTGRCSIAHNQVTGGNEVAIANGQDGFTYHTGTGAFSKITDPGFPGALSFDYVNQFITFIEPKRRFVGHSDLAAARDYNTNDRYEAESSPDRLVAQLIDHGRWLLFGEKTVEEWVNEPVSATQAFQRSGLVHQFGCAATHSPVSIDGAVVFLSPNGSVYEMRGPEIRRISTHAIEQALRRATLSKAFAHRWEDAGHKVYYLTFQDGYTWGFDFATRKWHRRQSYGLQRWRLNTLFFWNAAWYGGDYANGNLYRLQWDHPLEHEAPLVRERTGPFIGSAGNRLAFSAIELKMDVGQVPVHAPPVITGVLPDGVINTAYGEDLGIAGGLAPYSDAVVTAGSLPLGYALAIVGNVLTVTWPDTALPGTYTVTLRITDSRGEYAYSTQQIELPASPLAIEGLVGDGQVGLAYLDTLDVVGGYPPYSNLTISAGSLPPGLAESLAAALITIEGTPT